MKRRPLLSGLISVLLAVVFLFSMAGCTVQTIPTAGGNSEGKVITEYHYITDGDGGNDDGNYDNGYIDGWNAGYNAGYDDGYGDVDSSGNNNTGSDNNASGDNKPADDNTNTDNNTVGGNTDTESDPSEDDELPENNYDDVVVVPETEIFSDNFESYGEDGTFIKAYAMSGGDLSEAFVSTDRVEGSYSGRFDRTIGNDRWAALYYTFDGFQNWEKQQYVSFWAKGEGAMAFGMQYGGGSWATELVEIQPGWTFYSFSLASAHESAVMTDIRSIYFTWTGQTATAYIDDIRVTETEVKQYNKYLPAGDNNAVIENGEYYDGDANAVPPAYTVKAEEGYSASSSVALESGVKHSGDYAIKFTAKAEEGKTKAGFVGPFSAGKQASKFNKVTLWLKGDGGAEQKVTVALTQNGTELVSKEFTITGEWAQYELPITVPDGATAVEFNGIVLTTATDAQDRIFYLDDFALSLLDGIKETPANVIEDGEYYTDTYTVQDAYTATEGTVSLDSNEKKNGNYAVKFDVPATGGSAGSVGETIVIDNGETSLGKWSVLEGGGTVGSTEYGYDGTSAVMLSRNSGANTIWNVLTLNAPLAVKKGDTISLKVNHTETLAAGWWFWINDAEGTENNYFYGIDGKWDHRYIYYPGTGMDADMGIAPETWGTLTYTIKADATITEIRIMTEYNGADGYFIIDDLAVQKAPEQSESAENAVTFTYVPQPKAAAVKQHFVLNVKGNGSAEAIKGTVNMLDGAGATIASAAITLSDDEWQQVYVINSALFAKTVASVQFIFEKGSVGKTIWIDDFVFFIPERPDPNAKTVIIDNGEASLGTWKVYDGGGAIGTNTGYNSIFSTALVRNGGANNVWSKLVLDTPLTVKKGDTITLMVNHTENLAAGWWFWLIDDAGTENNYFYGIDGTWEHRYIYYPGTGYDADMGIAPETWGTLTYTVKADATITELRIMTEYNGSDGYFLIDDLTLNRAE